MYWRIETQTSTCNETRKSAYRTILIINNTNILNATIEYILSTKRFDGPLFWWKQKIFKQGYESVYFVFIAVVICIICKFLFYFLRICFIPGYPCNFRYLVIVIISFNFTVLYIHKYIYIYIYIYIKNCILRKSYYNFSEWVLFWPTL